MLKWAGIFLVVSIVAGLLGFKLVAGLAASVAKILFVILLVLLIVFIIRGITGYRRITK
ncbi:DUF1328 domain-containing protein [Geobacter sp. DSM 9736]|uniref:DUF1328 domain-containing protein n=1 Tax=Geobacter sp. DSM 9736 TaxID=1277350 RepID=UPI000B5093B6|nr:DUF1328 family protein [Geobacter sp. DSM 9736]SNB46038.1 Protein of unknown function [Geobacter sp. DSM 9736]